MKRSTTVAGARPRDVHHARAYARAASSVLPCLPLLLGACGDDSGGSDTTEVSSTAASDMTTEATTAGTAATTGTGATTTSSTGQDTSTTAGDPETSTGVTEDPEPVWEELNLPFDYNIVEVSGSGPNDIWLIANDENNLGRGLHYDGAQWTEELSGDQRFSALWTASEDAAWIAASSAGAVFRLDQGGWGLEFTPGVTNVYALWGVSASSVWMGTQTNVGVGPLFHFDGNWSEIPVSANGGVTDVWASGSDDLWIIRGGAGGGPLEQYDGLGWSEWVGIDKVTDLWGTGPDDVWATGPQGVFHYDGAQLFEIDLGVSISVVTLWSDDPDDIWIGGTDRLLQVKDGAVFDYSEDAGTPDSAWHIWGSDANDVWFFGYSLNDPVYHRTLGP